MADVRERCDNLEREMDKFKFIVKFLGVVFAALGITVSTSAVLLKKGYSELHALAVADDRQVKKLDGEVKGLAESIKTLTELQQQIAPLEKRLTSAQNNMRTLDDKLHSKGLQFSTAENLEKDIQAFESTAPTEADAWQAYVADMEKIDVLAVRYVGYVASSGDADPQNALNTELQNAAEAVRARTRLTPKNEGEEKYKWHVKDSPDNFNNLLKELERDRAQGLITHERLSCYKQAFPVWLDMVGVHGNPTMSNTPECRKLLILGN
jgi:hypothetical protein